MGWRILKEWDVLSVLFLPFFIPMRLYSWLTAHYHLLTMYEERNIQQNKIFLTLVISFFSTGQYPLCHKLVDGFHINWNLKKIFLWGNTWIHDHLKIICIYHLCAEWLGWEKNGKPLSVGCADRKHLGLEPAATPPDCLWAMETPTLCWWQQQECYEAKMIPLYR